MDAASSHTVDFTVTPWKLAKPAGMAADALLLSAPPADAAASSHEALWESPFPCLTCMLPLAAVAAPRRISIAASVQPVLAPLALRSHCRQLAGPFASAH